MAGDDALDLIVAAALRLSAARGWGAIGLKDIAAEAGLPLGELARHVASKGDILKTFSRGIDRRLLESLDTDPVEGTAHDRLFDVVLRRLEFLTPHKAAIASILATPPDSGAEWAGRLAAGLESQRWMLLSAGFEASGIRGDVLRLGLARLTRDVMRIWLADDDPGLARTMAALDRSLRDGEAWMKRLDAPLAICSALAAGLRAFNHARQRRPNPSQEASHAADRGLPADHVR